MPDAVMRERIERAWRESRWALGIGPDDAALSDPKQQFTNDEWEQALAVLRDFALRRPKIMLDDVARARAGR